MIEVDKCRWRLARYCQGNGIDLGYGGVPIVPWAIGIDRIQFKCGGLVGDVSKLEWFRDNAFDFVFSSHCLEHLSETELVLREWVRVLRPGGLLVLYLPHKKLYTAERIPHFSQEHKVEFDGEDIIKILDRIGEFNVVRYDVWDNDLEYSFDLVMEKD